MNRAWWRALAQSVAVGVLAGFLYWLMGVRSPAPPWVALAGLLGILAGEAATRRLRSRFGDRREDAARKS
ncbi:DUF1427 family protein [Streptomyces sp. NPDC005435]|uniref:DUF1427 family protein n=1 Tax=Streptomyces sp. NPDC005435 TaxID=3154464 RepID=UPI0034520259